MSWIFDVVDPRFDINRALKLLKPEAAVGREFERFTAEAKALARIEHPNVVRIYDFGRDEESNCFFYTMSLRSLAPQSSEAGWTRSSRQSLRSDWSFETRGEVEAAL